MRLPAVCTAFRARSDHSAWMMSAVIGRWGSSPSCHASFCGGGKGWAGRRRCSLGLLNGLVRAGDGLRGHGLFRATPP